MEEPTQNNADQVAAVATTSASVGNMLREARERLGMSVGDVANQIKFAPRQIEALEADDFRTMPESAFLRGFVRSYGKLLHLDSEALFAALPATKVATLSDAPAPNEMIFPNAQTARQQNLVWLGAALVFVVIALGFAIANFNTSVKPGKETPVETAVTLPGDMATVAEQPVVAASAVEPALTVDASATRVDVATKQTEAKSAKEPPIKAAKSVAQAKSTTQTPVKQTPEQVVAAPAAPIKATIPIDTLLGTQPARPVEAADAAAPSSGLRIVFGEESWAEIKDKNGKTLSSQVNLGGSELRLEGRAPFTMSVSHAKSVRLYYKGKQVDLTPYINKYSKNEVANITLE